MAEAPGRRHKFTPSSLSYVQYDTVSIFFVGHED